MAGYPCEGGVMSSERPLGSPKPLLPFGSRVPEGANPQPPLGSSSGFAFHSREADCCLPRLRMRSENSREQARRVTGSVPTPPSTAR
jgi:hypothetical protein